MKTSMFLLAAVASTSLFAAPVVTDVVMGQDASRNVTVSYKLTGEPAVVTLDITTNDVSIGEANVSFAVGDVNKLLQPGTDVKKIFWNPQKSWPGHVFKNREVKAVVTAWATNAPPDYMVVDLTAKNTVRYYTSTNALPDGGLANDVYRTERLVLRRIPAGNVEWRMGSPSKENNRSSSETPHYVTLTSDYYLGIYPFTRLQYKYVMESGTSDSNAMLPVHCSFDDLRGTTLGAKWPTDAERHEVDEGSIIDTIRDFTGVVVDLPTSAQWEFACRAGTGSAYNDGTDGVDPDSIVWYNDNSGKVCQRVGLLKPNAFGLYDMHGNVSDVCLDWALTASYYASDAAKIDPVGPTSGTQRLTRGGNALVALSRCRSAYCDAERPTYNGDAIGCRLCAPCIAK